MPDKYGTQMAVRVNLCGWLGRWQVNDRLGGSATGQASTLSQQRSWALARAARLRGNDGVRLRRSWVRQVYVAQSCRDGAAELVADLSTVVVRALWANTVINESDQEKKERMLPVAGFRS
jgi:hypothetical protein